ncbi:2-oxo acid dehydrogenase subunit E2 [Agromyces kandeliae]|uniref:2-oxo acid dehydrogenase subunit E2 n=1 Tax=Agromyces kandeliae TaxID=2666141 RepID=UPI0018A2026F|nr:2-oxo acid dehydrogenase subunit E2 [Agromyces kandeliae]
MTPRGRTVDGSGSVGERGRSPGYTIRRIPWERRPVLDRLAGARRRFLVHALVELDVGEAAARLAVAEPHVSWTGFVIACLARAVAAHPDVNVRRAGGRVLAFDHVDIGATVERQWAGRATLDIVTVHDADRVSPAEITALLHSVKTGPGVDHRPRGPMRAVLALPGPLRRTAIRIAGTFPGVAAGFGPAVGVTSIGMFSRSWGWAVPLAPLTVIATVGGVADRAVVRDGRVVARRMLPITLSFDHALIDGAPASRFTETLRRMIESASVLG